MPPTELTAAIVKLEFSEAAEPPTETSAERTALRPCAWHGVVEEPKGLLEEPKGFAVYALLPVQEGGSTVLAGTWRDIAPPCGTDMSLGIMPASWYGTPPEEGWSNNAGAMIVARRAASSSLSLFRCRCRFVVVVVVILSLATDLNV